MGIRIIGGEHRGRRLDVVDRPGLRPTTDRVRETIYNIVSHRVDLDGAAVLDLFAGSGGLGIEALSRGAGRVDFVERDRRAAAQIDRNLAELGIAEGTEVHVGDAEQLIGRLGRYDLVLVDPPYASVTTPSFARLLDRLPDHIHEDGLLLLEHGRTTQAPMIRGLTIPETRSVASTSISLYHRIDNETSS